MSEKEKRRPDGVQGGAARSSSQEKVDAAIMRHSLTGFKQEGGKA